MRKYTFGSLQNIEDKTMKKKKTPTYNMTLKQIEAERQKAWKDGFQKGKDDSFDLMIALPMIILRDKYGFGAVRLERFIEQMIDVFEAVYDGYVSFSDLLETLKDETGIDIRRPEKRETKSTN